MTGRRLMREKFLVMIIIGVVVLAMHPAGIGRAEPRAHDGECHRQQPYLQ